MNIKKMIRDLFWGLYDENYILDKINWDDVAEAKIKALGVELFTAQEELRFSVMLNDVRLKNFNDCTAINENLTAQIPKKSDIENYALENFTSMAKIAYKSKKNFLNKEYSVYLNEMIQPNAWEVQNFKRKIRRYKDVYEYFDSIGDSIAKYLVWTDDKNLDDSGDLYLTPSEAIAYKFVDCEDHAFLAASIEKELAVAYGSVQTDGNDSWHAFNCFIYKEDLYIFDTVTNNAFIEKYEDSNYVIDYIVTEKMTFEVEGRVNFGVIAGWE